MRRRSDAQDLLRVQLLLLIERHLATLTWQTAYDDLMLCRKQTGTEEIYKFTLRSDPPLKQMIHILCFKFKRQ
jgi:hypothetical protein